MDECKVEPRYGAPMDGYDIYECPGCGWTVQAPRKHVELAGPPICVHDEGDGDVELLRHVLMFKVNT